MSSTPSTPSKPSEPSNDEHVLVVPAQFDQVRRVTQFVRRIASAAGFADGVLDQIELAVDEACSNIVQHAYVGQSDGDIRAVVHTPLPLGRKITISLLDSGQPFDPDAVPAHDPAAPLDDLKVGGLGLFLIRHLMEDVHFEFGLAGEYPTDRRRYNRLTMSKTR